MAVVPAVTDGQERETERDMQKRLSGTGLERYTSGPGRQSVVTDKYDYDGGCVPSRPRPPTVLVPSRREVNSWWLS